MAGGVDGGGSEAAEAAELEVGSIDLAAPDEADAAVTIVMLEVGGADDEQATTTIALITRTTTGESALDIRLLLGGVCSLKTRRERFCHRHVGEPTRSGDSAFVGPTEGVTVAADRSATG
ncbi:MAG: hypothetical protein ABI553_10595 [Chloroflexota bacterium]